LAVSRFRFSWVLRDQLAIGPAPVTGAHVQRLHDEGIKSILSLCSPNEHVQLPELQQSFYSNRVILPDHRSGYAPTIDQMNAALVSLRDLRAHGPVFVHCLASMERAPLVSLAWLMREKGLTRLQALDYLGQIHPGTSPLPEQLAVLSELCGS
jgi:protein-tyrosine phosphatase